MKRIFKKAISVFLVVTMLLCAAPLNGFVGIQLPNFSSIFATKVGAADSGYGSVLASGSHGSKVTYVYYEDGTLIVSGSGSMRNDRISTAGQYNTNSRRWGGYEHQIKRVIINEGVTSIGDFAFYYCENLESVSMPSTITYIGSDAFHFCHKITSIQIPPNVKTIGQYSFGQMNLSSLVIPASVETILWRAFYANYNLKTVVFQKGAKVKSLGSYCFNNTAISKIMIPKTVTSIDSYAFSQCKYLTDVFYPGTQSEWKKISISSGNEKLTNSTMHYNSTYYAEELGVFYNYDTYNNEIVTVKVFDASENLVDNAEVNIYYGADLVATGLTSNGEANIDLKNNNTLLSVGMIAFMENATISAHLQLENGLELCSEEVKDNGQWAGAKLSDVISGKETLVTDEPRWVIPLMKVMVNESDVDSCKKVLRDYSSLFAQATNGHVIVNNFEIVTVPNNYKKKTQDSLKKIANDNNVDICMVRHSDTGAWATVGDYSFTQSGSLDTIYPGCAFPNSIIWCPINAGDCAKTLCHESGHYLLGLLDEYASAIGRYEIETGSCQNPKGYPANYVYDKNRDGKIGMSEKYSAYWKNNGGAIERPSYAPSNFGLMENQAKSIEMSRSSSYSGVNKSNVQEQTLHYYASQASCEEKMAWLLDEQVSEYAIKYTYAKQTQTASYFYAGGDNVTFSSSNITTNGLLNQFEIITNSENDITLKSTEYFEDGCNFSYLDGEVYLTSFELTEVEIYDINNTVIDSFELNCENNYTNSIIIEPDSSYVVIVYRTIDGVKYYNEYSLDVVPVNSSTDISDTPNTINLFSDTDSNAIVVSRYNNGESIVDGYFSLAYEYNICSENATEANGYLEKSVEFNLPIDYSSMTWFYKTDGEWVALDTYIGTDDHGNPMASCDYSGNGTYCLMAKNASDNIYSTPTELTVKNTDTIYDNDVIVIFTDSNENVLHYNIYYGTEPITAENCEDVNIYVANSTNVTISLENTETLYYFAVQAVGNDGGKSELSECVSAKGAIIDSDNDGLPDYWLDMFPTITELEDISGTDSDGDELTNFQEYQNGTNPLNPDTDGDNVYDSVEPWYNLNPLEPKTDGVTDDYTIVYGMPDVSINVSEFDISETDLTCLIENNTEGKAIRTSIYLYVCDELVDARVVNIDSNSSVEYTFSKEYLVDGMKIVIDKDKITRDSDYSNNEFAYSPVTGISTAVSNLTFLKSAREQLEFTCYPADSSDFLKWKSNNEKVITVDNYGNITCKSIGTAIVTVTTSLGYSCSYDILVEPFKGAGLTDFDCQLINDDSQVQIIGYVGDETSIVIPPTIGNINVVSISADAFINQWDITAISIHSGITSIGEYAFGDCWNLIDVYYDGSRYCYKQIDIAPYNYALDYANIHYSLVPTTAKNNAVLDDESGLIYGLSAGIDSIEDYTNIEIEGYHWEYTQAPNGFGTGTTALLTNGETVMDGYTVVIFGDVNGDGWYDGEDAFLVNLIAKGMLDKDDVGSAIWTAADCNHDGVIDETDVDLLTGAGLMLNDVDQSKTAAELATNSDYIEYVKLIDQSAGMNPGVNLDVDDSQQGTTDTNTPPEQSADEIDIEAILTNIFEFFKKLFTLVFSFIIK